MTRAKVTVAAFAVLTIVSGCASVENAMAYKTGTEITPELQQQLKTGQTTREDTTRLLGAPQSIETVGQELHYVYNYSEINHLSANKSELTRIIFSPDGTLKEIQKGAGPVENPLLGTR